MPRSWWQEIDYPVHVGSTGSTHDVTDTEPAPRLLGLKSVSNNAAWAMSRTRRPNERAVGFVHGRVRAPR